MKNITYFFITALILNSEFNSTAQSVVNYTESFDIISNPERGLQKYSITDPSYVNISNYSNLNSTTLINWRTDTDKITVLYRTFLLDSFINSSISNTYLSNMQLDFNVIRNSGLKCIVRFVYSQINNTSSQQASLANILLHIGQLKPILFLNKDIILTHQAGFIGTWGEWYYTNSTEFGDQGVINALQWQNRKAVVDSMLSSTPSSIPIQLRTPLYKKSMYGAGTLTNTSAYQNSSNARIGFYNDAFLNSWGDMGTYSVGSQFQTPVGTTDYTYLMNETQFTPMSGETSGLNSPRTDGTNAVLELNMTNWSTLNRDYYLQNFTDWITSNHYNEIVRRLGYRFTLTTSTFNQIGNNLQIEIKLQNTGYARAFKKRSCYLVLKNSTTNINYTFLLNTDYRTWADSTTISESVPLSSLPNGNYESFLFLPDEDTSLANHSEYSVQFANTNLWVDSTGMNKLNQTLNFISTSVNEQTFEDGSIKIFPNPANSFLNVCASKGVKIEKIEIFDLCGRLLYKEYSPNSILNRIDISKFLALDFLIIKLRTRNGVYSTKVCLSK